MKRRSLLSVGGLGLASVSGFGLSVQSRTAVRTPEISVEADSVADERDVSIAVSLEQGFSDDNPAQITIALTNTAAVEQRFQFGLTPPFSAYSPTESSSIYLVPNDTSSWLPVIDDDDRVPAEETDRSGTELIPDEPIHGCWRLPRSVGYHLSGVVLSMDPDETVQETYSIFGSSTSRQCLPSDDYRFIEENYLGLDWEWGITVSIA
ncbi:hypothetical protein [Natronolimnobius baerhuensis]|uniref:hypothetical protein n=1 Tax=Natronolimnobius baerhuensis TaxID=253108 RepID=UPI001125074F|nr:hypothetical protein [Natronolimnobius baerhuensis]